MKSAIRTAAICAALLTPVVSFAQVSNAPLTRAQVQADLIRLEQAGYNPAVSDDARYPADIQAAEARAAATRATTGVGGAGAGASQSGSQATPAAPVAPSQVGQ